MALIVMKLTHLLVVRFLACAVTVNAQMPSDHGEVEMSVGQDVFHANLQLNTDLVKLET